MGRPREFDAREALDQAMQVFWARGYEAASLTDLTKAMGISRSSLYEAFGGKRDLYLSALAHYDETRVSRVVRRLEGDGPLRVRIASVLSDVIDAAVEEGRRSGCFLCNAAVEVAPHDAGLAARVSDGLDRMEAAYRRALLDARNRGEIPEDRDPRALARFLVSSVNGLQVTAKVQPDRERLGEVARVIQSVLN